MMHAAAAEQPWHLACVTRLVALGATSSSQRHVNRQPARAHHTSSTHSRWHTRATFDRIEASSLPAALADRRFAVSEKHAAGGSGHKGSGAAVGGGKGYAQYLITTLRLFFTYLLCCELISAVASRPDHLLISACNFTPFHRAVGTPVTTTR